MATKLRKIVRFDLTFFRESMTSNLLSQRGVSFDENAGKVKGMEATSSHRTRSKALHPFRPSSRVTNRKTTPCIKCPCPGHRIRPRLLKLQNVPEVRWSATLTPYPRFSTNNVASAKPTFFNSRAHIAQTLPLPE